jgi:2-polyprenyl-3-methyl-5-hydroxy-6-metoxy-1,4-benzoquinol methylase
MPSCRPDVIPHVLNAVMSLKPVPTRILDVGAGRGKWGILLDEYLHYWKGVIPEIDAVEAHEPYRSPAYGVYRKVWYQDVMELLDVVRIYDLIVMVDVIEHLSREDGLRLLMAAKRYVISTPNYWSPQGPEFGNEYERHVSQWKPEDFKNSKVIPDSVGRSHIIGWR